MEQRSVWNNAAFRFILFLIILAAGWYFGRIVDFDVAYYQAFFSRYPLALSGAIFVLIYVATSTFLWFGPKDVLRIACAVLFGPYVSTIFVWTGEMVNAPIMFYLSRFLGRAYVQRRLGGNMQSLDKMQGDTSVLGAIAWRINPLVPFRFVDLGYGLTRMPFKKYFASIAV
ncbi:MAG TPA: VTT domain-containing protein, partial [Candidatus Omnitrophota bacterium]|nr:VTT domain-containing protein [Candidatus Omnitrophota bacterium]